MADETQIDSGADKPAATKVSRKKVATTKAATKKATTKKATTKKATGKKATRKKATRKKAKAAEPLVEADMSRPVRLHYYRFAPSRRPTGVVLHTSGGGRQAQSPVTVR